MAVASGPAARALAETNYNISRTTTALRDIQKPKQWKTAERPYSAQLPFHLK